eukprot:SAG11_NODE_948_length_6409_cov_7.859113_6_plen_49_part_00
MVDHGSYGGMHASWVSLLSPDVPTRFTYTIALVEQAGSIQDLVDLAAG